MENEKEVKEKLFDEMFFNPNTDSEWIAIIGESKAYLNNTKNREVKYLYTWLKDCVKTHYDAIMFMDKLESDIKHGKINRQDFYSLSALLSQMVTTGDFVIDNVEKINKYNDSLVAGLKQRIWSESDVSKIIQFRNIVTDLFMLQIIELEEYIDLNNDIDRYIQYAITSGNTDN